MILLDTHAWIWWTSDPDRLSKAALREIEAARSLAVAAISCWELAMLVERGRIGVDRSPLDWIEASLQTYGIELLPLTPAVAVRSTQLGRAFQGDPADRLIVATALLESATLATCDDHIRRFKPIKTVW